MISRRTDYDNKLAKVQKAKKEKPEWEEEMQAAKAKYEETRENVLTLMNTISDTQVRKSCLRKIKFGLDKSMSSVKEQLNSLTIFLFFIYNLLRMTMSQA